MKYLGVSAKLAAWRNPPNPTLVVWADSVYPDHLCRMYHICIVGYLSREIRNISKTAWGLSSFSKFPEFPGFLVKLAPEGLRIVFCGEILVFLATHSRIREVFGVSAKLAAYRNNHNPTLIVCADRVFLNPNGKDVSYLYRWVPIAGNSEHLQNRLGLSRFSEFPEFPGFLVKLASGGTRIFFLGDI